MPLHWFAQRLILLAAGGGRLSPLVLWPAWEAVAMRLWRVRSVRPGSILRFGASRYWGLSTTLADGTHVPSGARILHLHLDNRRLAAALGRAPLDPWPLAVMVNADLRALAEDVGSGRIGEVIALRGVTVLSGITHRFGFETRPLPRTLRWSLVHDLGGWVIASYHPEGVAEALRGIPWPGEIWMSAAALQRRFQAHPDGPRPHNFDHGRGARGTSGS